MTTTSFLAQLSDTLIVNAVTATGLAVLGWLLTRRMGRRPAFVHAVWCLVLLKLVVPSVFEVELWRRSAPMASTGSDLSAPSPQALEAFAVAIAELERREVSNQTNATDATAVTESASSAEAPTDDVGRIGESEASPSTMSTPSSSTAFNFRHVVLGLWLLGTLVVVTLAIRRTLRFRKLLRHARPAPDAARRRLEFLASRLGSTRVPTLLWLDARLSPLACGWGRRRRIVVPAQLWETLDPEGRDTMLLHELAHLHRRDNIVRLVEVLATLLYWWHPVTWWARRALHQAEEECCDAWVVATLPNARRAYADALLECVDFIAVSPRTLPLAARAMGEIGSLRRRLEMMWNENRSVRLSRGTRCVLVLAAIALLPLRPGVGQERRIDPLKRDLRDLDRVIDVVKKEGLDKDVVKVLRRVRKRLAKQGVMSRKLRDTQNAMADVRNRQAEMSARYEELKVEAQARAEELQNRRNSATMARAAREEERRRALALVAERPAIEKRVDRIENALKNMQDEMRSAFNNLQAARAASREEVKRRDDQSRMADARNALNRQVLRLEEERAKLEGAYRRDSQDAELGATLELLKDRESRVKAKSDRNATEWRWAQTREKLTLAQERNRVRRSALAAKLSTLRTHLVSLRVAVTSMEHDLARDPENATAEEQVLDLREGLAQTKASMQAVQSEMASLEAEAEKLSIEARHLKKTWDARSRGTKRSNGGGGR